MNFSSNSSTSIKMRPIRRFGTTNNNYISDRLSSRSHDKINNLSNYARSTPTWSTMSDDRARLRSLFYVNNYAATSASTSSTTISNDKENRRYDELNGTTNGLNGGEKPEIIMNTPAFQLVCDRRRVGQHRHASADEVLAIECPSNEKPPKSAMKKSPTDGDMSSGHRSRWASFRRSVSFADDKGLKLTDIKLIESVPEDHRLDTYSSFNRQMASGFIADFILPPSYRRLRALQVTDPTQPPTGSSQIVLESYTSSRWSISGVIAVRSHPEIVGQKRVFIRFTNDQWSTTTDNEATPSGSAANKTSDPNIERFSFTLPFPLRPQTGTRLEFKFGVRMPTGFGGALAPVTYWDDNHGSNYSFTFV